MQQNPFTNREMTDIVSELPLKETVRTALLGGENKMKQTLDYLIAREKNENTEQVDNPELMTIYLKALAWTVEI